MVFDGLRDATSPSEMIHPRGDDPGAKPYAVRVYEGRWLVDCLDCNGAELANPNDRWFWCSSCLNVGIGGKRRPVLWPENPEAIAAELRVRPVANRNWYPYETPKDLRQQNIDHLMELRQQRDALTAEIRRQERESA